MDTIMKRHGHTPEQAVRKIRKGERLLNEGQSLTEVLCHLEVVLPQGSDREMSLLQALDSACGP
jgi:hypothetical protein